jgi:hypothetical protein
MPRFIFLPASQPCTRPFQQAIFYSRVGRLLPENFGFSASELCACVYITPLFRKIKKLNRCSAALRPASVFAEKFSEILSFV